MRTRSFGVSDGPLSASQRWLCFASIFFLAFLAAFNLFKAAPAIQYIAADLAMPQTMVSQIMGVYSIAALVMAFPGMWFAQRVGFKFSALVAGVSMIVGSAICAIATTTAVFFVGRVIEGIGYGLVAVIGPNSVPRLLPAKSIGLAMGIWGQWLPIGTLVSFFIAPIAFNVGGGTQIAFSWHAVWWSATALEAVGLIWLLACFKLPSVGENDRALSASAQAGEIRRDFMGSVVLACLSFMVVTYLYVGNYNTFYPTFLQNYRGMSVELSSAFPMVAAAVGIVGGILFGTVASRRNARKPVIVAGHLCLATLFAFFLYTPGDDLYGPWFGTIMIGLVAGIVPACTYSLLPVLAPTPKRSDFALAMLSFFTALGKVLAGALVSPTLVAIGYYENAQFICAPMALAIAVLVALLMKSDRKVAKASSNPCAGHWNEKRPGPGR